MRIVLDGCVPVRLAAWLPGHEVKSLRQAVGTQDLDDGPLLSAIDGRCDLFITVDKGLPHQQRTAGLSYAILVLRARSNRLEHLIPLLGQVEGQLEQFGPGEIHWVGV